MECLLAEAVSVNGWDLRRSGDRRHDPRPRAAPITPDFHRETTLGVHILHLYVISVPYACIVMPERYSAPQNYMSKAHFSRTQLTITCKILCAYARRPDASNCYAEVLRSPSLHPFGYFRCRPAHPILALSTSFNDNTLKHYARALHLYHVRSQF